MAVRFGALQWTPLGARFMAIEALMRSLISLERSSMKLHPPAPAAMTTPRFYESPGPATDKALRILNEK